MRGAVFFDVDGTLTRGVSTTLHLAEVFGQVEKVLEMEEEYYRQLISNEEFSVIEAKGWAGHALADLGGHLDSLPLIDGIPDVVAWCREQQLIPVLATLAWSPVGEYLADRFGFDGWCGPELVHADGRFTGEVAVHFNEYDKRDFAVRFAHERGLDISECAAIGDSRSDMQIMRVVGLGIALNASDALKAITHVQLETEDLRDVIPLLDDWQSALG